jgi:hypothetical protein
MIGGTIIDLTRTVRWMRSGLYGQRGASSLSRPVPMRATQLDLPPRLFQ